MQARDRSEQLLDRRIAGMLKAYSLQQVTESLRRVLGRQIEQETNQSPAWHLRRALNIIEQADRALFGQHCGDTPHKPKHPSR